MIATGSIEAADDMICHATMKSQEHDQSCRVSNSLKPNRILRRVVSSHKGTYILCIYTPFTSNCDVLKSQWLAVNLPANMLQVHDLTSNKQHQELCRNCVDYKNHSILPPKHSMTGVPVID